MSEPQTTLRPTRKADGQPPILPTNDNTTPSAWAASSAADLFASLGGIADALKQRGERLEENNARLAAEVVSCREDLATEKQRVSDMNEVNAEKDMQIMRLRKKVQKLEGDVRQAKLEAAARIGPEELQQCLLMLTPEKAQDMLATLGLGLSGLPWWAEFVKQTMVAISEKESGKLVNISIGENKGLVAGQMLGRTATLTDVHA